MNLIKFSVTGYSTIKDAKYAALQSNNMPFVAYPESETEKGFRIINTMSRSKTSSITASTISSFILTIFYWL